MDTLISYEVVKEARCFWDEQRMRGKINKAVDMIKEEVEGGRLKWCRKHVQTLLRPYPPRKKVDEVLQRIADNDLGDADIDNEEPHAVADGGESDVESEFRLSVASEEEIEDAKGEMGEMGDVGAAVAAPSAALALPAESSGAVAVLAPEQAEEIDHSQAMVAAFKTAMASLREVGAMGSAVVLQNEIRKEERRQRHMRQQDPAVAGAFIRLTNAQEAEERRKLKVLRQDDLRRASVTRLRQEAEAARALLKKRKAEVLEYENLLEVSFAIKRYSPAMLGQGNAKGGGATGRKRRFEVLDRMARIGSGLSVAQKNEFGWFKDVWDEKLLGEFMGNWGETFASWIQKVLLELNEGKSNAFSEFVHSETERHFKDLPALLVPRCCSQLLEDSWPQLRLIN